MTDSEQQRTPAAETHDALVELIGAGAGCADPHGRAYALVKQTYAIGAAGLRQTAPEPLLHDLRPGPRFIPGSDFYPAKPCTDFVVQGSAYSPRPVQQLLVSVAVGRTSKRIHVLGRRVARFVDGAPRVSPPEPFEAIELSYDNAYGGVDYTVGLTPEEGVDPFTVAMLSCDHPGLYPRNPFGKGYLVRPGADGVELELPNLEDPDDLLTAERLVVGDPRRWYKQPLPWCFDWVHPMLFPRCVLFAADSDVWYPCPDEAALPEVERGLIAPGSRQGMRARPPDQGPHPMFYQDGSLGLVLHDMTGGEPVQLEGLHPERQSICFRLPPHPRLRISVEGDDVALPARLHHVVCRPDEGLVSLVYGCSRPLTRTFVPGIHKHIPIGVTVDGGAPVWYEPPPTFKEQRAAAAGATKEA